LEVFVFPLYGMEEKGLGWISGDEGGASVAAFEGGVFGV
jgi:hypothetical protein